jgi:formylglycine-generating enzyme required for sulfatase activity
MQVPAIFRIALLLAGVSLWVAFPAHAQQTPTPSEGKELVAVMELDGVNAGKPELAALSEELRAQLLQSGKFRVVDRQQIDAILKEQAFQQTGCTSQECAVQVGKILGVRKMVVGRVTKINDTLWQLSAQMVDAESAETVRAVTVNQKGAFDVVLTEGMTALAAKLTGSATPPTAVASGAPAASAQAGQTFREPVTGMEFVFVPGGSFQMGCGGSWDGECFPVEKPAHKVSLGGYWLGKTEVTQGQWKRVMGNNPSYSHIGDNYPVEGVSWDDVQQFIQRLNAQSSTGASYRLPTEAEWEYACRGGGQQVAWSWGNGPIAGNTNDASAKSTYISIGVGNGTVPVASFPANGLGFSEMSGNVWEWVQDSYTAYGPDPADNPLNQMSGIRVVRGGGWNNMAGYARCSYRGIGAPSDRVSYRGFRLARGR